MPQTKPENWPNKFQNVSDGNGCHCKGVYKWRTALGAYKCITCEYVRDEPPTAVVE